MDVVLAAFAGVKRQGHRRKPKAGDLGDFLKAMGVRSGTTGEHTVKIG